MNSIVWFIVVIWPFCNNSSLNNKNLLTKNSFSKRDFSMNNNFVLVMDTTLRDGEQTEGVCFSPKEKLILAQKLLDSVKVDFIEIASAKASLVEKESCSLIFSWAKEKNMLDRVEVLGFVDYNKSVDWIDFCGGKVINLLCKGSEKHCVEQLKKTPKEHFSDIKQTVDYAHSKGFFVNAYLEDFSNGVENSPDYVFDLIENLSSFGVRRLMLADTLGIFSPDKTKEFVSLVVKKFPDLHFDFHAHNDYGLAVANSLAAVFAGVRGVHCTINGLGERAGNTSLEEFVSGVNDFSKVKLNVLESELYSMSRITELFSRQRLARNKPIVGAVVFTQTAGVHADGDKKGGLYKSKLSAERFGRKTRYALGKLSGKSSVEMALREFGITVSDDELRLLLSRVIVLGEKKQFVTKEDLLFILDEIKSNGHKKIFEVSYFEIKSSSKKKPSAKIIFSFNEKKYSFSGKGDGGYDAFVDALKKFCKKTKITLPSLVDYEVRIPVGGMTDALVEAKITWLYNEGQFETAGISTDQVEAAIKATEKMVNVILLMKENPYLSISAKK